PSPQPADSAQQLLELAFRSPQRIPIENPRSEVPFPHMGNELGRHLHPSLAYLARRALRSQHRRAAAAARRAERAAAAG
uniref:hypothetical protein n=1 Tax=Nocardia cyriacigeorgica TaxID=135487 RepID=UPI003D76B8A3